MEEKSKKIDFIRKPNPFKNMKISDNEFLFDIKGRKPCSKCKKSRKFFCYTCYVPLDNLPPFPHVRLPVQIDIIKHHNEIDGKSTSAHAAILAPDNIKIYEYPDIPDYTKLGDGVVLIFPSHDATNIESLFTGVDLLDHTDLTINPNQKQRATLLSRKLKKLEIHENDENNSSVELMTNAEILYDYSNLPVKRAIFIDSTWNQCRGIFKDPKISSIKCIVLQNRLSQFWRHQKGSPRWYLSTVEAIHQFLLEIHMHSWGIDENYKGLEYLEINQELIDKHLIKNLNDKSKNDFNGCDNKDTAPYNGQYDNLLFFFVYMYGLIHSYYDHNKLKAYKRPIN